jgi:hypothetical protein
MGTMLAVPAGLGGSLFSATLLSIPLGLQLLLLLLLLLL